MNPEIQKKASLLSKDIWSDDLVSYDDSEDCSPQMPKVTHQFSNTLKDNKGKSNKEDFMNICEIPCKVQFFKDGPVIIGKSTAFKTSSKPHSRGKRVKPQSYNSISPRRNSKPLKEVPSSEILQLLISCREP
ncbi:unnamed protein product [Moneuplotes crassus]|uniref:Uncharacterized protein n=1 Tax=Euplotes crassus TaxID=5936 RepID=A0AAD1YA22_EUPCR|nr:unnamed protein product [Moneuplotes crassus]